jgi:hypothetical protein
MGVLFGFFLRRFSMNRFVKLVLSVFVVGALVVPGLSEAALFGPQYPERVDEEFMTALEEVQQCVGDLARTLRSVEELAQAELFFKVQRKRVTGIRVLARLLDDSLARYQGTPEFRAAVTIALRKLNEDLNHVELGLRGIETRPTSTADAHALGDRLLRSEAFRALYEKRGIKPVVVETVTNP